MMTIDEADSELLKKWTIKKLENISDADSDVLADYVLALVRSDDSEATTKANCVENLKDFLGDNAENFVDDVFNAIATKSYDPSRPPQKAPTALTQSSNRQSFERQKTSESSRKRQYRDWDADVASNGRMERPVKHPRKALRGSDRRGGRQPQSTKAHDGPQSLFMPPMIPPGMPSFDPNDPMGLFKAMQQMLGLGSSLNTNGTSTGHTYPRQRCRDYDTKGVCMAGSSCPYEHGEAPYVVSNSDMEYDPNNASLLNLVPNRTGHINTEAHNGQRGANGRHGIHTGRRLSGGIRDAPGNTIVVKHIPDAKCNEKSIRDFFSDFGTIDAVNVKPMQRLAIIKYEDHESAQNAYSSPKVVFDNRFVEVTWQRPRRGKPAKSSDSFLLSEAKSADVVMQEVDSINLDDVAKRQEEAQEKYETAKKQREEAEKQRQDLNTKLIAMEAERKKLADVLAKKSNGDGALAAHEAGHEDNEKTRVLREQLAKLEAEAQSLGIDPDASTSVGYGTHAAYRGGGGFRGRGRGRGFHAGARGTWAGSRGGTTGAVMRLDNRPKTLAVVFTDDDATYDTHHEKMGQFLLFNNLTFASTAKHPERDDAMLVIFNQRFEGENFMKMARDGQDLPYIGNVKISWHTGTASDVVAKSSTQPMEATSGKTTTHTPAQEHPAASHHGDGADEVVDDENLDYY